MSNQPVKIKIGGVTLLELIVTIAVIAILVTIAAPSLTDLIRNNRITAQSNELVALLSLAKSQAIRRNSEYVVEFRLRPDQREWDAYLNRTVTAIAEDEDAGIEAEDPECREQAIRCAEHERVMLTIDGDAAPMRFDQRGYIDSLQPRVLSLQHDSCRGNRQRRVITVSGTGQISAESAPCL